MEEKHELNPAERRMAEEKVSRLLLKYSLPTIIGMLVNSLYNTVDRIWVGKIPDVGTEALSGIGLCMPLMNVIMGLSMLVGIGAAACISIRLGRRDHEGAEQILGNALSLIAIIGVAVTILGVVFAQPLLEMIGARDLTMPHALPYMRIIFGGCLFNMMAFALNHPIRATGDPVRFARTQLVGGITNAILDPIFIFVFDMGIAGAAVATVISQAVSLVMVLQHYISPKAVLRFKRSCLRPRWSTAAAIFAIGLSPFLMQIAGSVVTIVVNRSLVRYGDIAFGANGGDIAIGAMTVISSIAMLFMMPVFGINQGAQPIIGFNYGAGNVKRVRDALKWSVIYAMIITAIGFVAVELFAEQLVVLFNPDPLLIEIGARGMRIFLSMFIIVGLQVPMSNFFQAIGRAKISIVLSLLRQVILLIPAYLILPLIFGFSGIWYAGPMADVIAGIVTCAFVVRELKHMRLGIGAHAERAL